MSIRKRSIFISWGEAILIFIIIFFMGVGVMRITLPCWGGGQNTISSSVGGGGGGVEKSNVRIFWRIGGNRLLLGD